MDVGHAVHDEGAERPHAPEGERQADGAARRGEQQALDQELAHDPPRARAEAGAHGDLTPAGGGSRQQQVGDVGAGDQQHGADGAQDEEQRRPHLARQLLRQRFGDDDRFRRLVGIARGLAPALEAEVVAEPRHLAPGVVDAASLAQAAQHRVAPAVGARGVGPEWDPQLGPAREVEAGRHHTHDGEGIAVENERLADDLRVAAEAALPQAVAQQGDDVPVLRFLLGQERAPQQRHPPQQGEEVRRDGGRVQPLGIARAGEGRAERRVGARVLQRLAAGPVVDVGGVGVVEDRDAHLRHRPPEGHDAIRLRERQRPQQHGVHDAEYGGVGPDPERERDERYRGEGRVLTQGPQPVTEVAAEAAKEARLPIAHDTSPEALTG